MEPVDDRVALARAAVVGRQKDAEVAGFPEDLAIVGAILNQGRVSVRCRSNQEKKRSQSRGQIAYSTTWWDDWIGMKLAVAADHGGFPLKARIIRDLNERGHTTVDLGTDSTDPVDYPDYARFVAEALLQGLADRAILICGSGAGACVAANKFPGIRRPPATIPSRLTSQWKMTT